MTAYVDCVRVSVALAFTTILLTLPAKPEICEAVRVWAVVVVPSPMARIPAEVLPEKLTLPRIGLEPTSPNIEVESPKLTFPENMPPDEDKLKVLPEAIDKVLPPVPRL